ncbi:MAG: hypothetical protein Tsb0010_08500 [Parvularculaceae bacterium]
MLAFAFAFSAIAPAAAGEYDVSEAQRRFDALAENFPALNATVMVKREIVWEAEGGVMRGPEDGLDVGYNVYSVAKMLTGLAFARLESQGEIDLDQPVQRIEPRLPAAYAHVTARQLLSHRGGVRHYSSDKDWIEFGQMRCETPQDALGHFIEDPLRYAPGERFHYSTYGFVLLSHLLVQHLRADSFDAAMRQALGPHYQARTDSDEADKAQGYLGEVGAFEPVSLSAECKFGGGGLIASARNLAAMGAALAAGDIVTREVAEERFMAPAAANDDGAAYLYGMSVGYDETAEAHYSVHSGGSPGGRAYLLVFYEPRVAVALTANYDGPRHSETAIALGRIFAGAAPDAE